LSTELKQLIAGSLAAFERDRECYDPRDRDLAVSLVGTERFREMIEAVRAFA
jgi:hypothetical protein